MIFHSSLANFQQLGFETSQDGRHVGGTEYQVDQAYELRLGGTGLMAASVETSRKGSKFLLSSDFCCLFSIVDSVRVSFLNWCCS